MDVILVIRDNPVLLFRGLLRLFLTTMVAVFFAACDTGRGDQALLDESDCNIPVGQVVDGGVGKDGIPSLQNPPLVSADSPDAAYLQPDNRIIGLVLDGEAIAVPHNVLWSHEILNLDRNGSEIAVSYCPLTGSSVTFDRAPHGGATFGVSGLLWQNNLIMYDRNTNESLWPQMLREAGCGSEIGKPLDQYPSSEMSWAGWRTLHPDTRVVSDETGFFRSYTDATYPYGSYEDPNNGSTLFRQNVNDDRPPKERVLGIPEGTGGKLYPFFELDTPEMVTVVNDFVDNRPVVVFWEDESRAAVAFESFLEGTRLTFSIDGNQFVDQQTGSTWDLQGRAIAGEMAGAQLQLVKEAYVAFWFAWKAFHPDSEVWIADGTN